MTNQKTGSVIRIFDTVTGGEEMRDFILRELIWLDDNADIADNDDLVFKLNKETITIKVQQNLSNGSPAAFRLGPYNPGIPINQFQVTTLDAGVILMIVA